MPHGGRITRPSCTVLVPSLRPANFNPTGRPAGRAGRNGGARAQWPPAGENHRHRRRSERLRTAGWTLVLMGHSKRFPSQDEAPVNDDGGWAGTNRTHSLARSLRRKRQISRCTPPSRRRRGSILLLLDVGLIPVPSAGATSFGNRLCCFAYHVVCL